MSTKSIRTTPVSGEVSKGSRSRFELRICLQNVEGAVPTKERLAGARTSRYTNPVAKALIVLLGDRLVNRRRAVSCRVVVAGVSFDGPVDGGAGDAEPVGKLGGAVVAGFVQATRWASWRAFNLDCLPRSRPFALATFMPSRVRRRMRSASNSATIANTLNNNRPTGSVGSCTTPPKLSLTWRRVRSSRIARASGSDRAKRSSLVTTSVSPARQAARASRRPGRSRLAPVSP
jgi:hypothetical protein